MVRLARVTAQWDGWAVSDEVSVISPDLGDLRVRRSRLILSPMVEGVHELERLTARQLQQLIDAGMSTVVLPFGSVEYHGGHLPLGADSVLADVVGAQVARQLGAVLAPTVRVGCSGQHTHLPGTLTLRPETLTTLATEHARVLARHGFALIVLLSTHGGNRLALDAAVAELNTSLSRAVVCAPRGDVGPSPGTYSGAWLTSVMLALRPELVELAHAGPELAAELETASAKQGQAHIERFTASVVASVRTLRSP
jgi:creatinine amidohydrolase/Fe(II)-dependent formamide hydrolase-like protein